MTQSTLRHCSSLTFKLVTSWSCVLKWRLQKWVWVNWHFFLKVGVGEQWEQTWWSSWEGTCSRLSTSRVSSNLFFTLEGNEWKQRLFPLTYHLQNVHCRQQKSLYYLSVAITEESQNMQICFCFQSLTSGHKMPHTSPKSPSSASVCWSFNRTQHLHIGR